VSSYRARAAVVLAAISLAVTATVSAPARGPSHSLRVPIAEQPQPLPPEPLALPPPSGPCADPQQRCPDLVVRPPSQLRIIRSRSGRVRLGSRNVLVNRGSGPLHIEGARIGLRTMSVSQRIYTRGGSHAGHPLPGARLDLWFIPGQGDYWKLRDGLRFELWRLDGPLPAFVKLGRKTRFCMRDLFEAPGHTGPRSRIFPACSQDPRARTVRMGISAGWAESYPAFYHEQYVDVTGLRGCFGLRHVADPMQHVLESDESNNSSQTRVRLPVIGGVVRGC